MSELLVAAPMRVEAMLVGRGARRVAAVGALESRPVPVWIPPAALAALASAVYANCLPNGFIGDDQFQLLRNPAVKDIAAIPRLFGAGVSSFWGVTANYYRPMSLCHL